MNLKEFKNVTTKPCDIEFDKNYLEKLSQLPKTAPKRHTFEIISTVAAAVLIVVAVGIWAIIGRGIRANTVDVVGGSYTEVPVTDELNAKLNMELFGKYDVFCFREFDEKNPLSEHELLQINRYAKNAITVNDPVTHSEYTTNANGEVAYVTGKMINDYAEKMFGITPAHDFAIYGCVIELGDVDYAGAKVDKISTEDLSDGTKKIRIEYNDFTRLRVLEYIGTDLFTPIRFTAFYRDDTELLKDYADVEIYKVLCNELDNDKNIESYLLYISEAPTKTKQGYSAKIILDYSFTDGKPHSILGSINEYKDKQTAEIVCEFKKTQDGHLKLIKENGEDNKPTFTNVTKWYEERSEKILKEYINNPDKNKPKPTNANPKTKEFEFLGKKYNLNLKETIYQRNSWMMYRYTDGSGTAFTFDENGELLEYEYGGTPINSGTVTKDDAKKIAKDFAQKMYGDQFDDYVFYEFYEYAPSGPAESYNFSFTKRYGKDKSLNGECCSVSIKINGDVLECGIKDLYEFKKYDLSIFENITHADIEEKVLSSFAQSDDYTYEIENGHIAFIDGKNIISVGIIQTHKSGGSAGIMRYLEVT